MRIAIVCLWFARMQRMRSLAEGLAATGHEPVFLTAEPGAFDERYEVVSIPYVSAGARAKSAVGVETDANIAEVARKRGVLFERVIRFGARLWEATFLYPDKHRGWIPAFNRWLATNPDKASGIDVVIASMWPPTALFVGRSLAHAAKRPLILDFRDLWTANELYSLGSLRRAIDRIVERRILEQADAVTTVTRHLMDELRKDAPAQRVRLIHTGVDPASWTTPARRLPDGALRFGHFGVWMSGRRSIRSLLNSLRRLADQCAVDLERIRIDMWGEIDDALISDTRETGTDGILLFHGRVPPDAVPGLLAGVDVALVPTWPEDVWSIPLKVYHYLVAGKTILILGSSPESDMRQMVFGLPGVDFDDTPEELDAHVMRYYRAVIGEGGTLDWTLDERPVPVTRDEMTSQFLDLIGEVVGQ